MGLAHLFDLISVSLSPATVGPATLVFFLEHIQLILIFPLSFPPKEDAFLPDSLFQVLSQVLTLQRIILLHLQSTPTGQSISLLYRLVSFHTQYMLLSDISILLVHCRHFLHWKSFLFHGPFCSELWGKDLHYDKIITHFFHECSLIFSYVKL